MPFIPSMPAPRPDMSQGQSPIARHVGPFGHGIPPTQLKQDPAAGMPPINMPSNYPTWQQHSMNGMQSGQLGMHGSPMANGTPVSIGTPRVSALNMLPMTCAKESFEWPMHGPCGLNNSYKYCSMAQEPVGYRLHSFRCLSKLLELPQSHEGS